MEKGYKQRNKGYLRNNASRFWAYIASSARKSKTYFAFRSLSASNNIILVFAVIGVVLCLVFILAYFSGTFNLGQSVDYLWQCLSGGNLDIFASAHKYYCPGQNNASSWPKILIFGVIILGVLTPFISRGRGKRWLELFFTPIGLVILTSLAAGLISVLVFKQYDGLYLVDRILTGHAYLAKNGAPIGSQTIPILSVVVFLTIAVRTALKLAILILLSFIFQNIGRKIILKSNIRAEEMADFPYLYPVVCIAIGLSVYGLLLTALSLMGMLNTASNRLLLLVSAMISYDSSFWRAGVLRLRTSIFSAKNDNGTVKKISRLGIVLLFLAISWLGFNLLEITTPVPQGWDGLSLYQNYGKNLFETGHAPAGLGMRFWETFTSQGFSLLNTVGNAELSLLLSFFGIFLVLISIFLLFKHHWPSNRNILLLAPLIFYTMPMVYFQTAKDLKVDAILTFFLLASLNLSIIVFEKLTKKERPDSIPTDLALLIFLLGVAFSIKYTAIFFIVPFSFYIAAVCWKLKVGMKKNLARVSLFLFLFLIPLSPWLIENFIYTKGFDIQNLWRMGGQNIVINPYELAAKYPELSLPPPPMSRLNLDSRFNLDMGGGAYNEEVLRYSGYDDNIWDKYFLKPLQIHLNDKVGGQYVDVGFLWLSLLALFLPIAYWFKRDAKFAVLGLFTLVYWLLWALLAKGIPWYGMPGFIMLLLLFGHWYHASAEISIIIRRFFVAVVFAWIIVASLLQFGQFDKPFVLGYGGGYLTSEETAKQMATWYYEIGREINSHPETKLSPNHVYRIGTLVPYFIKDSFGRIFNDPQLDNFSLLYGEKDQYATTLRLALLGFRYVIVDLNAASIDQTPEKTLTQKFNRLMSFINNNPNLVVRLYKPQAAILFLEIDPKLVALYKPN